MSKPLHPNLARLAASYDMIFERFSSGSIDVKQAKSEIAALSARDDQGVIWSIDPDSGKWLRLTRSGQTIEDEPPTYGLATATPFELSGSGAPDPDSRLEMGVVNENLSRAPGQYTGMTRQVGFTSETGGSGFDWEKHKRTITIAGIAVAIVASALFLGFHHFGKTNLAPAPAPVTTTVPVHP